MTRLRRTFHFSNNTLHAPPDTQRTVGLRQWHKRASRSVQRATDPAFEITVEDKCFFLTIYDGATMAKREGRRARDQLLSGSNRLRTDDHVALTSHVTANSNQISQEAVANDHTYLCDGSCSLSSASSGNTHCGPSPSLFGSSAFVDS